MQIVSGRQRAIGLPGRMAAPVEIQFHFLRSPTRLGQIFEIYASAALGAFQFRAIAIRLSLFMANNN